MVRENVGPEESEHEEELQQGKNWDCASDIVTISFKSSLRYFFSIFTSGGLLPGAIDNPLDKPSLPPIKAAAVTETYGARRPRTSNPGFR